MSKPTFGISITRVDNERRPAITTDMSIVGLVFTAPDADATVFPINRVVQFFSDDTAKLAKMGKTGTGPIAVELINQQLGEFQASATIIGVRVDQGADVTKTIANLRGDLNGRTGMYALLNAGAEIGITPRLICIPGFTSQTSDRHLSITVTNGGTKYTSAPNVALTGGGGTGAAAVAILGTGADAGKVVSVTITKGGTGYTSAPTVAFTGGGGTDAAATASMAEASNAIVAGLPTLLERLLAVAVVDGPSTDLATAIAWRKSIQSERIIPVDPGVKYMNAAGQVVVVPASPAIIGIAVRRDHEFQGRPFHSWANQPLYGIVGPARPIDFSILDGATEGQQLLAKNIGVIVRGESSDGAIADGGFIFIGTDSCAKDTLWQFYNQLRGRDYIHLMFLKTLRSFLGKRNIDRGTTEDIIATMKSALRDIQATGDLLGFRVGFNKDVNSPEQLRLGRFTVSFQAEEPPVLRHIGVQSARYRHALDALLDDLLNSLDAAI